MKIAVSSQGASLDSQIDQRFGRAAFILIVETDGMDVEVLDNSENINAAQGAGIQAASTVSGKGVDALLTGSCGPKAMTAFSATGVKVFTGQTGTVRQAVERFKQGGLQPSAEANVGEKYGAGGTGVNSASGQFQGGGRKMGGGCGRGMGGGGGRGMGGGGGHGMGMQGSGNFSLAGSPVVSSGQESLEALKKQAADLQQQMEEIQKKINNI